MIAGWIQAIDYTILHMWYCYTIRFLLLTRRKKLKACYQHFTRGHLQLISRVCVVQFLRQQSLNFLLDDVTGTVQKRNCGRSAVLQGCVQATALILKQHLD